MAVQETALPREVLDALSRVVARQSGDDVKRDLELTCDDCGEHLCDIEPDDNMETLARMALDHECVA